MLFNYYNYYITPKLHFYSDKYEIFCSNTAIYFQVATIAYSRQTLIKFDPTWLEMDEIIIFEVIGQKIIPLSINPGRIVLTSLNVYFQPFNNYEVVSYLIYYIIFNTFIDNMQLYN